MELGTRNFKRFSKGAEESRFWNKLSETMPREKLDELHVRRLKKLVSYVYENSEFYRSRFDEIGLQPGDIRTLEDFRKNVPLTDKDDFLSLQAEKPPYGPTQSLPPELIAHHAETSGTTGVPLAIPYSLYDTIRYGESWCPAFWATGIRPSDSFYFAFGWGNFAGFWSAYWGVRRFGGKVISGGGLNTEGHIQAIQRLKPTVLISTPTFALRLAAVAKQMGVDVAESSVRFTMHAGEPGPTALPAMKKEILNVWGVENAGELLGIAEIDAFAPCNSIGDGVHVDEMSVYSWVADPKTGKEISEGKIGEHIVTSYTNGTQPLLNYRTHDLVRPRYSCASGRTWLKFDGSVLGRTDFMISLRGTNVYPTAVENVLGSTDG
ncbi:MAG: AMP-binding protein, partial [Pseudomonadota bacterium]|nr:AMP-binding protein [Pseudomonadota bacterium]